jgi:hypothetical protein
MRVAQGYASGAVDYLPTPVVPEILRAKVQVFAELFQMRRISASQARESARRAAAEEAARRSEFLAAAGHALTRSIDFEQTLHALAGIGVPFLSDVSVLCLADPYSRSPRMETVWNDPGAGPFDRERREPICPYPWLVEVMERTLLSNESRIMTALPSTPEANAWSLARSRRRPCARPPAGCARKGVRRLRVPAPLDGAQFRLRRGIARA